MDKKIFIGMIVGVLLLSVVSAGWFTGNAIWDGNYCSKNNKCDAGEGDCDKDTHCNTGYCAKNVGERYGQAKGMDVCEYKMGDNCNALFSIVESSYRSALGDSNYDARADIELDGNIDTGDFSYFSPNSQDEEWCGNRLSLHCAKLLNLFNDAWGSSSGDSNFDARMDLDNSGSIGTGDWSYITPNVENENWCATQVAGSGSSSGGGGSGSTPTPPAVTPPSSGGSGGGSSSSTGTYSACYDKGGSTTSFGDWSPYDNPSILHNSVEVSCAPGEEILISDFTCNPRAWKEPVYVGGVSASSRYSAGQPIKSRVLTCIGGESQGILNVVCCKKS